MKKIMSIVLILIVILTQFVPVLASETANNVLLPKMLSGSIMNETDNTIEVKSHNNNSVVLNILPSTYIIDAVTGSPVMLKDRIGDAVVVNYGPAETKSLLPQSDAVVVICNIPQDYIPPHYAKVEAIERNDNEVKVTTDAGSLIVTINKDVPISSYRTKHMVTIGDINIGTELTLWYTAVAMSYPGQTTATKAVILGQDNAPISNQNNKSKYSSFEIVIEDISLAMDAADVGKVVTKAKDESVYIFNINGTTRLLDLDTMDFIKITDLKKGQEVQAFHNNSNPVLAIAPPQFTPNVLVVKNKNNFKSVKLDFFDQNGLSSDNRLVIKVSDNTPIFDSDGNKLLKEDIADRDLIVFYSIATASLPPQAPPEKIIVLTDKNDYAAPITPTKQQIISSLTEEQLFKKDGETYIRLSDVAEALGFNVKWNGTFSTVSMSKNALSIVITIGKNDYDYVDSMQQFTNPPLILNGRTFVEIDFIDTLIK